MRGRAQGQVAGLRTDIADLGGDAERQFALDVERVLLHIGRSRVRIDQREALADAGQTARACCRRAAESAVGNGIRERSEPASDCYRWTRCSWWSGCSRPSRSASRARTAARRRCRSRRAPRSSNSAGRRSRSADPTCCDRDCRPCSCRCPAYCTTPLGEMPVTLAASGFAAVPSKFTTMPLFTSCKPGSCSQRRPRFRVSLLLTRKSSCM